ncbi:hypothetical protein IWW50_003021 [Coemansia erecta]|nr:hypothetical protein IWW50_003021 [Coemansia erecta]
MGPQLNADIKERICQAAHIQDAQKTPELAYVHPYPRHFSTACMALTHVDRSWRHVGLRYAWRTVYIDDALSNAAITAMRLTHGAYTRKLWIQVKFHSIASHYRRYAQTHENSDIQPFCDLARWPHLADLEIVYAHKCAFPGLASYLEPRLGRVRRLTIKGRVPIDMRRGALMLRSPDIEEIHFCAMPRCDDSLSSISSHSDPVLSLPIAASVSAITMTTLVDIRIVRSVLAQTRCQLRRLELIGLSSEQLATARVFCHYTTSTQQSARVWTQLLALSIKLSTESDGGSPVCVSLDPEEFPKLTNLAIADCPCSVAEEPEHPACISYGKSFSKQWPCLAHVRLQTLSNGDAWAIARSVSQLTTLHVSSDMLISPQCTMSAAGLWNLLTAALPLQSVSIRCAFAQAAFVDKHSDVRLDFGQVSKTSALYVVDTPHIVLTTHQAQDIRRACQNLVKLEVGNKKCGSSSISEHRGAEQRLCTPLLTSSHRRLASLVNFWRVE